MECLHHLVSSQGAAVTDRSVPPSLNLGLTITQLGGDSMAAMRISSLIQERFSVELSVQYLLEHPLTEVYQLLLLPPQHPRSAPHLHMLRDVVFRYIIS